VIGPAQPKKAKCIFFPFSAAGYTVHLSK